MKEIVLVILLILPAFILGSDYKDVCGRPAACPHVPDGDPTCAESAPHFVLLAEEQRRNRRATNRRQIPPHCGGSLVSDRHVVTAAHCIIYENTDRTSEDYPNDLVAYVGVTNRYNSDKEDGKEKRKVKKITIHEGWNKYTVVDGHDLAVIELDRPVTFSNKIRPICLPQQDDYVLIDEGKDVTLNGFGNIERNPDNLVRLFPVVLQLGELEILNDIECRATWSGFASNGSQLCARGRDGSRTNSCQGDSGSGLVSHNPATGRETLVGVVSYGEGICGGNRNRPSVYTNILEYDDWINNIINPPTFCRHNQFQCETWEQCINIDWKCDGLKDCRDGSDENHPDCQVHGGWGSWGRWTPCSVSCGGGVQSRGRSCTNPAPQNEGRNCPGDQVERRNCYTEQCEIDGGWSSWTSCSKSCGSGVQTRSCTEPAPAHGGSQCSGSTEELCNTQPCPVLTVNGGWSSWGSCSRTCGSGIRTRTCTQPRPTHGGSGCSGPSKQYCYTRACGSTTSFLCAIKCNSAFCPDCK